MRHRNRQVPNRGRTEGRIKRYIRRAAAGKHLHGQGGVDLRRWQRPVGLNRAARRPHLQKPPAVEAVAEVEA